MTTTNKISKTKLKSILIELKNNAENLTKKDIGMWRDSWQMALNPENPQRLNLYRIYRDVMVDNHLSGCITQRKGYVMKKSFKLVDKAGKEKPELTELFEAEWFKNFCSLALDSIYFGHSLIQFGDLYNRNGLLYFDNTELIPRENVIPEYGVFVREAGDEPSRGYSYRDGIFANTCIEIGKPKDLGLLLKITPQSLSKKNMMAYWDTFGEMFGMPIRIGKTASRDPKEIAKAESFLRDMAGASWGLFPEGTEVEIKETSRGDAFNVYDQRINRCNSEISKAILGQTMTIDSGSSLSQSEVHLEVFNNIIEADADMLRDAINWKLIPFLVIHGFPLDGYRFDWDNSIDYTPEQQLQIEKMLLTNYDIDPAYFAEKYNIKILGKKESTAPSLRAGDDRFFV
ncbi:MAG: DUF935 family protein [Bacteroidales bacterium]|nr:DUF935 family protein [Bacteroidales bacterium]